MMMAPIDTVAIEWYSLQPNMNIKETFNIFLENTPFSQGGFRFAHKTYNVNLANCFQDPWVLKMSIDPLQRTESLARSQIYMQNRCKMYAEQYNWEPYTPKKITYVLCNLVRVLSGQYAGSYGCMEKFMPGNYEKHNCANPCLDGESLTNRNTPQAFSHYTFEKSGRTEMVVDVQGVGDMYTDPQIYSTGIVQLYGPGDGTKIDVDKFFQNHVCNNICQWLGLPRMKIETNPVATTVRPMQLPLLMPPPLPMPPSMLFSTSTVAATQVWVK